MELPEVDIIIVDHGWGWLAVGNRKLYENIFNQHGDIPSCLAWLIGRLEGVIDHGV